MKTLDLTTALVAFAEPVLVQVPPNPGCKCPWVR